MRETEMKRQLRPVYLAILEQYLYALQFLLKELFR